MQQPTLQIRDKLLTGLDKDYNVINMDIVIDVLSQLENFTITREALEATRLGKHINELRRKAQDKYLANRAKNLVKKWRQLLVTSNNTSLKENGTSGLNSNSHSPALVPSGASAVTTTIPGHKSQQGIASNGKVMTNNNNQSSLLSSQPSSASTSPCLSRPTTPSASQNDSSVVLKTRASNKRLRKIEEKHEVDSPPMKQQALNGYSVASKNSVDFLLDTDTRDSINSTGSSNVAAMQCDNSNIGQTRVPLQNQEESQTNDSYVSLSTTNGKTSRQKSRQARRSVDKQQTDVLEEQMLSVRKSGKVRTTQEIIQELAMRSHSPGLVQRGTISSAASNNVDVSEGMNIKETKTQLMNRFFDSQTNLNSADGSMISPSVSNVPSPTSASDVASQTMISASKDASRTTSPVNGVKQDKIAENSNAKETVEEIMARLPVISASEVMATWEEEDDEDEQEIDGLIPAKKSEIEVTTKLVNKLHSDKMEHFNGNFDHKGDFREWHEVLSKETKDGEMLYILPYSIIE